MITINLFDYRQELKKISIQKRVMGGVGIIIVFMIGCGAVWGLEQIKIKKISGEIAEVQGAVDGLSRVVKKVKSMQGQIKRLDQIITGIRGLRSGKVGPVEMLVDINRGIPTGLWLTSMMQTNWKDLESKKVPVIFIKNPDAKKKKKRRKKRKNRADPDEEKVFLEIKGKAFSDKVVARYIEQLEAIPYFNVVFLHKSMKVRNDPFRNFTIYCYMKPEAKKKAKRKA